MTSSLRKKIADTTTLAEALRMLEGEPDLAGALKIKAGGLEGTVAFSKGRITGAAVSPSGERGQAAIRKLSGLGTGSVRYAKFHEIFPLGEQLNLSFASVLHPGSPAGDSRTQLSKAGDLAAQGEMPTKGDLSAQGEMPTEGEMLAQGAMPTEGERTGEEEQSLDGESAGEGKASSNGELSGNGGDFHAVHGALSYENKPSLSDYQLSRMETAKEEPSNGKDFHESHPQLDDKSREDELARRHAELLEKVDKDEKPFDHVDQHITWNVPSLTDEQREKLAKAADEGRDLESFEKVTEFLQQQGLFLNPRQSFELQELAKSRSKAEQVKEFHEPVGLTHSERIEMRALVEDERQAQAKEEAPKGPTVTNDDRVPLDLLPVPPMPPKPPLRKGIIGRVATLANYKWSVKVQIPRRKQPTYATFSISIGTAMGIACLVGLAVGIFVVPDYIKHSGHTTSEQRARERLRQSIHEDLSEDRPQETAEMKSRHMAAHTDNKGELSHIANTGRTDLPVTEDLRFGRYLVTHARFEDSIEYYENYIHLVPENFQARLELINVYLATGNRKKARLMCIRTLKQNPSSADMAAVWQLLSQCQTD